MDQSAAPTAAPARAFAALHHPGARAYLVGTAIVMMADSIEHVVSYWMMFQLFHSHVLAGFAVISHWVPFLLLSLWAGALADRFDPRRIIQIGMFFFVLASLAWGILFLTGTLERWHAVTILVVHGFAGVLWGPAGQMLIQDIVPPAQLQSGVRLIATARTLGVLLGPAVGGAMMLAVGPGTAVIVNAALYLPLTWWLWKAPYGPRFQPGAAKPRAAIRGWSDLVMTMRAVRSNRVIISMTLLTGAAAFFVGHAYQPLMPAFAADFGFPRNEIAYSVLMAAAAAGALTAGIGLEMRGALNASPRTAIVLVILWCVATLGFAAATNYYLGIALLFGIGFLHLAYSAMAQTLVQLEAPPEIRGRVIGLFSSSAFGLLSFSGVFVGFGASLVGIHWSLGGSVFALLLLVLGASLYAPRLRAT